MTAKKPKTKPKKKTTKINVGGRPPHFKDVKEITKAINDYFNSGLKMREVIVGRKDKQQVIKIPVPTITGLALFLGFCSRQSFYDYEKNDAFSYIIKRARTFIEKEYEEQLQVGNTIGAIFALKQMGWVDQQNINHTGLEKLGERLIAADKRVKDGSD